MEKTVLTVVCSVLIGLLGWLGTINYNKLAEINKELIALKLEVVQIQKDMLTKDDVREMIDTELLKHGIK